MSAVHATTGVPDRRPPLYGDPRCWALVQSDALALLQQLPDSCIEAIVTDPPYGINFNGEAWDGGALADGLGFQAFTRAWAEEARRILKPGGYLASFGATRTMHRQIAGIEDAGLEVRDQLLWMYGSGMPKSRRMAGGLGSALKPAYEPIVLSRAPLDRAAPTLVANVTAHGTGALNVDATRIVDQDFRNAHGELLGRWPANVTLGHHDRCVEGDSRCAMGCAVAEIDQEYPDAKPSRFFYSAKATTQEREAGLDALPLAGAEIFSGSGKTPRANVHPTVKPIGLMRWLIRLVVPPGGIVLDPFAGSGSTGCAAVLEGLQFIGIERDARYAEIACHRIRHWARVAEKERHS